MDRELIMDLRAEIRKMAREEVKKAVEEHDKTTDKRTETNACDLIYRQAVLALPRNIERNAFGEVVEENINVVHVKGIPSVDAVPVRRGRWIRDEFGSRCECCGLYAYRDKADRPWESDYCPYCGADLRGKKHEGSD